MSKFPVIAAVLLLLPSSAFALETPGLRLVDPTAAELQAFIQQAWPDIRRRVRHQDRLTQTPSHLTSLPQTICRLEMPRTYECVSLVEFEFPGGTRGSAFLRHHVAQDSDGRLGDAIMIRETPRPR